LTSERDKEEQVRIIEELSETAGVELGAVTMLQEFGITEEFLKSLLSDKQPKSSTVAPGKSSDKNLLDIEKAAIEFIIGQEKDWVKARQNNTGYDLYKTDFTTGDRVLFCEVKSSSKKRSSVQMTRPEFEAAQRYGPRYWLYIVENVGNSEISLTRIHDPAGKIERFSFGTNWKTLASSPPPVEFIRPPLL